MERRSIESHAGGRLLKWAAIASLVWMFAARILGPSDAFDQTQPKTLAYTTDILVNGRWVLPLERGEEPATKPPLYNWLAAPAVAVIGFSSELAHKLPSILALCVTWVVLVRLGRAIDPHPDGAMGWLAGLMLPANYAIFKLGYLARPDMLLTMFVFIGWIACTALLVRGGLATRAAAPAQRRLILQLTLWLSVGLAFLTKGPAAIILILYAALAGRIVVGRWSATRSLGWWWGLPLAIGIAAAWLGTVWTADADHVRDVLWRQEIYDRFTGELSRTRESTAWHWALGVPEMLAYLLMRLAPWSLVVIIAAWRFLQRPSQHDDDDANTAIRPWLRAAFGLLIMTIILFGLSAGRRADYIAIAFPSALVPAAWWLSLQLHGRRGGTARRVIPALAAITLISLTAANELQLDSPHRGFGPAIDRFIDESAAAIDAQPMPVLAYGSGLTHLKAFLGISSPDVHVADVEEALQRGEPFWLISGRSVTPDQDFGQWLGLRHPELSLTLVAQSEWLARDRGWPTQVTLYRVEP